MSTNSRIGKTSPVISQVNVARVTLRSQEISDWQNAVNAARNELFPRRKQLLELYENLKLDGHLQAVLGRRTTNVTNKRIVWVQDDASEELHDQIKGNILETPWFYDFIQNSMEVVGFGTTLIELIPEKGLISKCEVFPRANVVPEFGHIAKDAVNPMEPWLMYRTDPYYSTYLIEVGKPKDLGAMLIALPYILYKRGTLGDWAQFAELFGMPFRVGQYNPFDESSRQKLLTALSEMGGAGYAVIPDGTSLDFHTASSGTGQGAIYKDLYELCNSELSKLFLGQTMTTDSGSSRSQGEVHQDVEEGITLSDMRRVEFLLNWELKDRLERLGYPVAKGKFSFDMTLNLPMDKRILIDEKVAQQLGGLPERYWRETYNIPEPTEEERKELEERLAKKAALAPAVKDPKVDEPADEETEDPEVEDTKDQKKKPSRSAAMTVALHTWYASSHDHHHDVAAGEEDFEGSDPIMQELAKAIHDGRITDGWVDPALMKWTADQLTKGLFEGMEVDDSEQPQSKELRDRMVRDVHVFSGFKTYQTLRQATDALLDEDGQFRSFSQFKKQVLAIDKQYNVDYLRTEYNNAVASAQMAERWAEIEADKDLFPYLRYVTAGDDRVRPVHEGLDGITEPVDHPIWGRIYPPNDWGCRCDVEQVRRLDDGAKRLVGDGPVLPPMFDNNVGKTGVLFPKSHPYYKAPKEVVAQVEQAVEDMPARLGTEQWKDVPVPEIPKGPTTRPKGTPVAQEMDIQLSGKNKKTATDIISTIDKVHGDGELPKILLTHDHEVQYGNYTNKNGPLRIRVDFDDPHHRIHIIHEVGHWFDSSVLLTERGVWGSFNAKDTVKHPMKPLYNAIIKSAAITHMQSVADLETKAKDASGQEVELLDEELRNLEEYLLQPEEMFARAYTQYIVEKSGRADLMEDIVTWDRRRFNGDLRRHWTPQDFAPIRKAFDTLFARNGWLTK